MGCCSPKTLINLIHNLKNSECSSMHYSNFLKLVSKFHFFNEKVLDVVASEKNDQSDLLNFFIGSSNILLKVLKSSSY